MNNFKLHLQITVIFRYIKKDMPLKVSIKKHLKKTIVVALQVCEGYSSHGLIYSPMSCRYLIVNLWTTY